MRIKNEISKRTHTCCQQSRLLGDTHIRQLHICAMDGWGLREFPLTENGGLLERAGDLELKLTN